MDIKQLKFLVALDETRHFGQAAARCHVTQPTLSMRLRSLEDELGLQLVIRSQRFEGFTAEGERILAWAWCRWPASIPCNWCGHSPNAIPTCASNCSR